MFAAAPISPAPQPTDFAGWLTEHPRAALWLGLFCLWVSLSLIARLWMVHRAAPLPRKLFWSAALLVPLLGWFFYAAFFRPLGRSGSPGHAEHGRDAPYIGGGGPF